MMSSDAKTLAEYLSRLKQENDIINGQMVKYNEGLMKGEEIGEARGLVKGEEIGEARGLVKGEEIGKEIGRKQNALEIARNLLNRNLAIGEVSQIVGLPLAEIEGLRGF